MGRGQDYFLLGLARALETGWNSYSRSRSYRQEADNDAARLQQSERYRQQQLELGADRAQDYRRQVDIQERGVDLRAERQAMLERQAAEKLAAPTQLPTNNAAANAISAARQAAGPGASLSDIAERVKAMGFDTQGKAPLPPDETADSAQRAIYEQRKAEFDQKQHQSEAIQRWLNSEQEKEPRRNLQKQGYNPSQQDWYLKGNQGPPPQDVPRETQPGPGPGGMKPLGMLEQPRMPPIDEQAFSQAPQGPGAGPMAQSLMGSWARNFNIGMGLVPSTMTEYLKAWAWLAQTQTGQMPEHLQLMLNGPGGAPDMGGGFA
jgi:hypothetical protein